MRILVLNANTSDVVTGKVAAAGRAARFARYRDRRRSPATFGARVIGTRAEHAIGEHSTIALVGAPAPGCDAVVIAVSYDTGLRGARELLTIPVVGMTEAGLLTACMLGGTIGVVDVRAARAAALSASWSTATGSPTHRRLARAGEHRGLRARRPPGARSGDRRRGERPRRARCRRDGADRRGDGRRAAPAAGDVPVPMVDCIGAGSQAEMLAQLGASQAAGRQLRRPRRPRAGGRRSRDRARVRRGRQAAIGRIEGRLRSHDRFATRRSSAARRSSGPAASGSRCTWRSTSSTTHSAKGWSRSWCPACRSPTCSTIRGASTATGSARGGCRGVRRARAARDGARQLRPLRALPRVVAAFRRRGDEIAAHGRTNSERQGHSTRPPSGR